MAHARRTQAARKPPGPKLYRTREFPRSGSKAKDGEKEEERLNDGNNNGQATHGARKPPGPKAHSGDHDS